MAREFSKRLKESGTDGCLGGGQRQVDVCISSLFRLFSGLRQMEISCHV